MKNAFVFVSVALALAALYMLQSFRTLALAGVNPDLVLVAFFLILFSRVPRSAFLSFLAVFLLFVLFVTPFWLFGACVLAFLLFLASFFRRSLTAYAFADYFFFIAFGTLLFYAFASLASNMGAHGLAFSLFSFSLPAVLWLEAAYNLALGAVLWLFFHQSLSRALAMKR